MTIHQGSKPKRLLIMSLSYRRMAVRIYEALQRLSVLAPTRKLEAERLAQDAMALLGFVPSELEGLVREAAAWWVCKDCNGYPDDYMVFRSVWEAAGMQRGFLCIDCLEQRLGRPLVSADFPRTAEELRLNQRFQLLPPKGPKFANNLFWRAYALGKAEAMAANLRGGVEHHHGGKETRA